MTQPRGIRLNNPGNIRHSNEKWLGKSADQPDASFVKFDAPAYGIRAMARILINYNKRGLDTIHEIINAWAPPNENDTGAYISAVSQDSGIDWATPIEIDDVDAMLPLVKAIIRHENGQVPYADAVILDGLRMAGVSGSKPRPAAPRNLAAGTAGVASVAAGAQSVVSQINDAQGVLAPLAPYLPWAGLAIAVLGALGAGYVMWRQYHDRKMGVA